VAITEDASTPAIVVLTGQSGTVTWTTASFSPPAGSLLIAMWADDFSTSGTPNPTVSSTISGNPAWTAGPHLYSASGYGAGIYTLQLGSAPGSVTVSFANAAGTGTQGGMLAVRVLTGAAASQAGAASAFLSGTSSASQFSNITPTTVGSLIYVVNDDDAASTLFTPTAATANLPFTTQNSVQSDATEGCAFMTGRSAVPTTPAQAGTATSFGWTVSGAALWAWAALEILPAMPSVLIAQPGATWRRRFQHKQVLTTAAPPPAPTAGPPLTPLKAPVRARLPQQGTRGHGGFSHGTSGGTGPPQAPRARAVRVRLPQQARTRGHGGGSHGAFGGTGTGAILTPLDGPVRARLPQQARARGHGWGSAGTVTVIPVAASAGLATAAGAASQAGGQNAQLASSTGAAQPAAAATGARAGLAAGTGAVPPAGQAQAQLASGAGAALNATVSATSSASAPSGLAAGIGAGLQAGGQNAQLATAAGAALQPSVSGSGTAVAGLAAGAAAALQAGGQNTQLAAGTGAAQPAVAAAGARAGLASGTGTAQNAAAAQGVRAGLASGTGTAQQPSVSGSGTAIAGLAAGTGTAQPAAAAVAPTAGLIFPRYLAPLYIYPNPLTPWTATIAGAPAVQYIVVNPASGPGLSADPNYTAAIAAVQAAGITVLGYVDTNYGAVPASTVSANIGLWQSLYGVTSGIFFDRASSDPAFVPYQTAATALVHAVPGAVAVLNHGTVPAQGYADAGDVLVVFESAVATWPPPTLPAWTSAWPRSKFCALVYNVTGAPAMQAVLSQAMALNIGVVNITDEPDDFFSALPGYMSAEFAALSVLAEPAAPLAAAVAQQPQAAIQVTAGLATAAGAAQQPAVQTAGSTSAPAGLATGTGAVPPAGQAQAQQATAAGTAQPAAAAAGARAGLAAGTGAVPPAGQAQAQQAAAAGAALPVVFTVTSPGLEGYGFGSFAQVPAGSVITSVIANVVQHGSDAGITAPSYQLWDGTAALIGSAAGNASLAPGNTDSVVFTGVTYSQLATLRLRINAGSVTGNSGATVSADAAGLSVSWAPAASAAVFPGTLAVTPALPVPAVSGGISTTVTPGTLAVVPALPQASATMSAAVFPGTLAVTPALPAPAVSSSISTTVTPGTLAVVPALPAATATLGATVFPGALSAPVIIPAPTAASGMTVTPGTLAVIPALPPATATLSAAVFPGTLAARTIIPAPAASSGVTVTPGVLAVVPALPAVTDPTVPGWAASEDIIAGGNGSWANPGNVTGPPDGSSAVWTVPLCWRYQACGRMAPGSRSKGVVVASEFAEKARSVGYLSRGRTRDREESGREHPDSGKPWKSVTDELGNTVTEHGDPGSGVSARQDVEIRPDTVQATPVLP
jgi:hypothetical protein